MGADATAQQNCERVRLIYAPSTLFIKDISERLKTLDMPVYFKLPGPEVLEPFIVIGGHSATDGPSSLNGGNVIEDIALRVDIYLPNNSRTKAEETRFNAIKAIGRRRGVASDLLMDDSIGREVYHIPIRISEILS